MAAAAPVSMFTAFAPADEKVTAPALVYVPPADMVAVPTCELFVLTLKTEVVPPPACRFNKLPEDPEALRFAVIRACPDTGFPVAVTSRVDLIPHN